jgi:dapdiamide synthase
MKQQRQAIVIVGAYSTGFQIAPSLLGRGYACIHVDMDFPRSGTYDPSVFFIREFKLASTDDAALEDVIRQLRAYDIKSVVAASECGVCVANKIAAHFAVPRNPTHRARFQRHKYGMIEALQSRPIPSAEPSRSKHIKKMLAGYQTHGLKQVVMKPSLGAYSEGVGMCHGEVEIRNVIEQNLVKPNFVGGRTEEYVIREFLDGPHYIVNTVSVAGNHFVTDIWRDVHHYEDTLLIDEYSDIVPRDAPEFAQLASFISPVLDALQIRNGPAHSGIKLTSHGPRLIETGARLAGGLDFSVVEECNGFSQISVLTESLTSPQFFPGRCALYERSRSKAARFIYMFSEVAGRIGSQLDLSSLFAIPSLMSVNLTIEAGGMLEKTKYSLGCPGYAMLLAEDSKDIARDYDAFRQLERHFFADLVAAKNSANA